MQHLDAFYYWINKARLPWRCLVCGFQGHGADPEAHVRECLKRGGAK